MPNDRDVARSPLEFELAIWVLLMVLVFPVVWIHYYLFALVPLALLPSWMARVGLPTPAWAGAVYVLGVLGLGAIPVYGNVYYEAREMEWGFRLWMSVRPLAALLLLAAALPLLRAWGERERPNPV